MNHARVLHSVLLPKAKSKAKPELQLVEVEEDRLMTELSVLAKQIIHLKINFDNVNACEDTLTADRIALKLTSAEQEFFLLFNTLRDLRETEPLQGKRFTGDFSYESYLFNTRN